MWYHSLALAVVAALIVSPTSATADPITFTANLSAANENPPTMSGGTGFATVVLDSTAQTLQVAATFSGLTSNVTAAHIHCCQMVPGTNIGGIEGGLTYFNIHTVN